jgi:hypothetical protein
VKHHLQVAKENHDTNLALLARERAKPAAPDSVLPQTQPSSGEGGPSGTGSGH